jgi:probable sporulation protein (polysaccharide deacetylase family)
VLRQIVLLLGFFLFVTYIITQNESIRLFVSTVKAQSDPLAMETSYKMTTSDNRQALAKLIQTEAAKRKTAPINAKVDPVWKAIPAYNGLEVDIEQTVKLAMGKQASSPITYIMKETTPAILLDDLGHHPIFKGNPQKPMASIMINVAWGNEFLPSILETLDQERVHATFFFDGSWLSKNLDTAKLIQSKGHELSNHAYSHKNMSQLSRAKAIDEISKTQDLLKQLGVANRLFAPPSGDFDQETVQIAAELGMKTILWTLDTVDWTNPGAARIINKISARVEPGSMILMHPTRSSSEALPEMIRSMKRKGLIIGTVSELISPKRADVPR